MKARLTKALSGPGAAMLVLAGIMAGMLFGPAIAHAQSYGMPPADVGDGGDGGDGSPAGAGGGGGAGLVVRVGQLEEQVRQLNGKIEQLQYANHQLEDQLKKFQQDVEFRFQELGHKGGRPLQKRSDAAPSPPPAVAGEDTPNTTANAMPSDAGTDLSGGAAGAAPAAPQASARDDAFDPTKDPGAPGAPKPLGAVQPGSDGVAMGDSVGGDAPINLLSSPQHSGTAGPPPAPSSALSPAPGPAAAGNVPYGHATPAPAKTGFTSADGTVIADPQANPTKEQFEIALGYLKQKDYEDAERGFAAFIAKNPKNRRISDALYYLGETYYLRGRQSEAAEQYLKISTNYANSPRAPEAMLRLGEALHALGAKEQACATFGEVPRKYPNASAAIKATAEREAKRLQCG